ncbi:long-chain fatty acid--CoA ligase [Acidiphilium sp. AL]|uniref:Long-chain fatty acid--CoA ligase n=1 Tax=Acidiphilium iwatense TaxID=768198 RepID=A0ABS9E0U0_9PROT|nr:MULTISPECIES: long-chain fatty acid--CoA ligase [Acidiphilium]MCF3948636.1 long-chain fatty acid--CoA ligase [Acidiphilium iwatense]MCU4161371.1 long-chain fatty acid--CoA ligase [Acidiphilium sp. AL]
MHGLMQHEPMMISDLLRHAARYHPRSEIVSRRPDGVHRQTYPETERRARRLAQALIRLGIAPGDRVATLAWNSHRHVELYFAISGIGAVINTINPRLAHDDIAYIADHAEDRVIFADVDFAPILAAVVPKLAARPRHIVFLNDSGDIQDCTLPASISVSAYETLIAAEDGDYEWPRFEETTASGLCYTSGTTGKPKGVLYSHRSTVLLAMAVNAADACGLRAADRLMPVVPMFHVNAWSLPYAAAACGASLIMPGRFLDGASLAGLIADEHVTISAGVPTVWLGVLDHLRETGQRLPSLQRLVIGGSACPPALFEQFDALGVEIRHAWGMTESSPLATLAAPVAGVDADAAANQRLSQGRTIFGVELRARDEKATEVPWNGKTQGNIELRGHWVATGYYRMPKGTTADGWFPTGDVGTIDPDGFVYLTDRTKDLIKSGGEWISSIALENIAVAHPAVAEAAAIAAKHRKWGERPLLIVALRPGASLTKAELLAFYEDKVPRWSVPDDVIFIDELPHGATGKLLKTALRSRFGDYFIRAEDVV